MMRFILQTTNLIIVSLKRIGTLYGRDKFLFKYNKDISVND